MNPSLSLSSSTGDGEYKEEESGEEEVIPATEVQPHQFVMFS